MKPKDNTKKLMWQGIRNPLPGDNIVRMSVDGELWANLPLYLEEINHSPTGFEWGYNGSGPAQLAYAILRTYFEIAAGMTPERARALAQKEYYEFKDAVVCNHFGRSWYWELDSEQVRIWRVGGGI